MVLKTIDHGLDYLMSTRLKNSLEIEVKIVKDLYLFSGIFGDMGVDVDDPSPKIFDIRLNYSGVQSFEYMIKVLCHELVHVSQYAKNRLKYLHRDNRMSFCSEKYDWDIKYDDRPWEIEAYELEGKIFDYVTQKAPEIKEYTKAKACHRWRPELTL